MGKGKGKGKKKSLRKAMGGKGAFFQRQKKQKRPKGPPGEIQEKKPK